MRRLWQDRYTFLRILLWQHLGDLFLLHLLSRQPGKSKDNHREKVCWVVVGFCVVWFLGVLVSCLFGFFACWFLGFLTPWFTGFLVSWFLSFFVAKCLGFLVHWFLSCLGFLDSSFLGWLVSWVQSFLVSKLLSFSVSWYIGFKVLGFKVPWFLHLFASEIQKTCNVCWKIWIPY